MEDPDHDWNSTDASAQFVGSGDKCTPTEYQVATGYADPPDGHEQEARYHLRLNQNSSAGPGGDWRTVATPHYDVHIDKPGCEDAVPPDQPATPNRDSGFDLARGHVKNDWLAAYDGMVGDVQSWRNTRLIHQCNPEADWDSGSNGRVYYLDSDEAASLAPALELPTKHDSALSAAQQAQDYSLKPCGEEFPQYQLGESLRGLALHSHSRRCSEPDPTPTKAAGGAVDPDSLGRANFDSYVYGTCEILAEQGCAPPLEIQSWPACERSAADYNAGPPGGAHRIEPVETTQLRGVPARFYADNSAELSTGAVTVVIYAHTASSC